MADVMSGGGLSGGAALLAQCFRARGHCSCGLGRRAGEEHGAGLVRLRLRRQLLMVVMMMMRLLLLFLVLLQLDAWLCASDRSSRRTEQRRRRHRPCAIFVAVGATFTFVFSSSFS